MVVLFDIDKTLLIGSHCHFYSFIQAFRDVYGVNVNLNISEVQGMTDRQIIFQVVKKNNIKEFNLNDFEDIIEKIVYHYKRNLKKENVKPLRGAEGILKTLQEMEVPRGIVTGNIEDIAWLKLKKARFDDYFSFGGFGDEGCERSTILKLAIQRAEKIHGKNQKKTIVVGDTPRDILAGREVGILTVGVATGDFSEEELRKVGAHYVLKSLGEKEKFIKIISPSSTPITDSPQ